MISPAAQTACLLSGLYGFRHRAAAIGAAIGRRFAMAEAKS
jgi:hypothetical protein